ncbi:MAG: 50S ribosomal protein L16 [Patescibacteria group bacterium]|jgi:large subunit ribosomal protein L16|nr:50S ribosomal protein L16 [Patescibacteria group bacterium]
MLSPRKVKHRKWHKGRTKTKADRCVEVSFGSYGLKSLEAKWITARQIEAARRSITRFIKRKGKVWIRIFPDKPVTTKSAEVPMGGGKGAVDHYVAVIKPGTVLMELDGVNEESAREALRLAGHKFPVKTKFVIKN